MSKIITPDQPFGAITDHVRRIDQKLERALDVTFVEFAKMPDGSLEMLHPASGKRKVIKFPPKMTDMEEKAQYMQEMASKFVEEEVKPHG